MEYFIDETDRHNLVLHKKESKYKVIIGIDPGTVNLGIAMLMINKKDDVLEKIDVINLRVRGTIPLYERIMMMGETLERIFKRVNPESIGIETPYISRTTMPAAIPLGRLYQRIMDSVINTSRFIIRHIPHYAISPNEAKRRAGNSSNGKLDMLESLQKDRYLMKVLKDSNVKIDDLTEHTCDAIWIALVTLEKYRKYDGELEPHIPKKRKKKRKKND